MAEFILGVIYAFIFAVIISAVNMINGNPKRLTLRGRRVLFSIALVIGFAMAQYVLHIQWNCDLRPQSTNATCAVAWK